MGQPFFHKKKIDFELNKFETEMEENKWNTSNKSTILCFHSKQKW
jgi:hypothetical protein